MTLLDPAPELVHVLSISTRSPHDCVEAVAAVLRRCGGRMLGFSLKPAGASYSAVLRLGGIDEAAAGRIAGLFSAWPEAGSAHLEHQVLSR
jgi:hypothetical protein